VSRSDYIIKRIAAAVVTVFVAITVNFVLFRALPGTAVTNLSHVPNAGPGLQRALTKEFGLNRSLLAQYGLYLWQLLHLNLGVSFYNQQPVTSNLATDLLNTIPMVTLATVFSILLGIVTGVVSAWRRGTATEHLSVVPALGFYATPVQWLGLIMITLLGAYLPTTGRTNPYLINPSFIQHWADVMEHMLLPSLTLGLVLYGQYTLIVRSAMLETLGEDYVFTAKAIGYSNARVIRRYAFRNAMLPVVSVIALSFGFIVGGAILVETVFNWPGIGYEVYQAVLQRDYPMLEGAFLLLTVSVIVCNLLADLLYFRLDPRISAR
jgi:ABC-type dipeptide/oligopeptide/nickel transport system permease component